MKIRDIIAPLEEFAPLDWQAEYDNAGLIVGDVDAATDIALVCVDITEAVLEEAIELGAGLVIAHHPVIFHPLKHITGGTYIERVVARAIRHNVALYACHTNLDAAKGGMSFRLGNLLGLQNVSILDPSGRFPDVGFGIVGELEKEMPAMEFLGYVKTKLGLKSMRYSDITQPLVSRVALCTGAGASMAVMAKCAGAQVYISSDFKYNDFLDADRELVIADVGHFESEYCAIDLICDIITKKIPNFALRKSQRSVNPVNYLV